MSLHPGQTQPLRAVAPTPAPVEGRSGRHGTPDTGGNPPAREPQLSRAVWPVHVRDGNRARGAVLSVDGHSLVWETASDSVAVLFGKTLLLLLLWPLYWINPTFRPQPAQSRSLDARNCDAHVIVNPDAEHTARLLIAEPRRGTATVFLLDTPTAYQVRAFVHATN